MEEDDCAEAALDFGVTLSVEELPALWEFAGVGLVEGGVTSCFFWTDGDDWALCAGVACVTGGLGCDTGLGLFSAMTLALSIFETSFERPENPMGVLVLFMMNSACYITSGIFRLNDRHPC